MNRKKVKNVYKIKDISIKKGNVKSKIKKLLQIGINLTKGTWKEIR